MAWRRQYGMELRLANAALGARVRRRFRVSTTGASARQANLPQPVRQVRAFPGRWRLRRLRWYCGDAAAKSHPRFQDRRVSDRFAAGASYRLEERRRQRAVRARRVHRRSSVERWQADPIDDPFAARQSRDRRLQRCEIRFEDRRGSILFGRGESTMGGLWAMSDSGEPFPIIIEGTEQSVVNPTLADAGLPPVVGVQSFQVFR